MKDMTLWIWLTQLGLSVAVPPVGFILLALWLRENCNWGNWVIWVGVFFGVYSAIEGLRASLKAMSMLNKGDKKTDEPLSFNEHV